MGVKASDRGRYFAAELPDLTGLRLAESLYLEHLGVFPVSNCEGGFGRSWAASEIDEWAAALKAPGMRDWIKSLLTDRVSARGG